MRNIWIVLITLIITAGIIGGGGWWYMKNKAASEKKDLQTQIETLNKQIDELKASQSSSSSSASSSTSASAKGPDENLTAAKAVVKNFLDAKKTRSLENAKPYMTTAFYSSSNQEGFAGTSSPSMGRYTISTAEYLSAADLYKVKARVYQNLQNEEVGYSDNSYMVAVEDGDFLVNEVIEGEWTDTD